MKSKRRDFEILGTIKAAVDLEMYDVVTEDGTKAGDSDVAFGFVIEDSVSGRHVAVCRRGFCPVKQNNGESVSQGNALVLSATPGKLDIAPTASATFTVVAIAEEDSNGNGTQLGAYVDCIAYGRTVTLGA